MFVTFIMTLSCFLMVHGTLLTHNIFVDLGKLLQTRKMNVSKYNFLDEGEHALFNGRTMALLNTTFQDPHVNTCELKIV